MQFKEPGKLTGREIAFASRVIAALALLWATAILFGLASACDQPRRIVCTAAFWISSSAHLPIQVSTALVWAILGVLCVFNGWRKWSESKNLRGVV